MARAAVGATPAEIIGEEDLIARGDIGDGGAGGEDYAGAFYVMYLVRGRGKK